MHKKLIFFDLDGTLISHSTNSVPPKTKLAIQKLQENGHIVAIATGRAPSLFYGIEKELGIDTYVASNGRYCIHQGHVVLNDPIPKEDVHQLVLLCEKEKIDLAFETSEDYVLNSENTELPKKFSDVFHLQHPKVRRQFHIGKDVHQMVMFYDQADFKKFGELFPNLNFSYSNQYGIDVNAKGGLKDIGIKALVDYLGVSIQDTIAFGDGFNDISMLKLCHIGVAMGNAHSEVKQAADFVTEHIDEDGVYHMLVRLNLIEKE